MEQQDPVLKSEEKQAMKQGLICLIVAYVLVLSLAFIILYNECGFCARFANWFSGVALVPPAFGLFMTGAIKLKILS